MMTQKDILRKIEQTNKQIETEDIQGIEDELDDILDELEFEKWENER